MKVRAIPTFTLIAACLCFCVCVSEAAITLPLQGYCKPGRYFPIQIDASDSAGDLTLSTEGGLTTQVRAGQGIRIVPMLVTGFPTSLNIATQNTPALNNPTLNNPTLNTPPLNSTAHPPLSLRTPGENEKLVASTNDDVSAASPLFPGQKLLPIRLDATDPLPGNPIVWESLDAMVLDNTTWTRITDAQRSALLGSGVMLISTGVKAPDDRWPWQHRGVVWTLAISPAGPAGELVNADLYAPTYGWTPGWSPSIRGQVLGVGGLLVLLTVALMLRPNRWTIAVAFVLALSTALGVAMWRKSLSVISLTGGDVLIDHGGLIQRDEWVYERAAENTLADIPWSGSTHPIFPSDASLNQLRVSLSAEGKLSYQWTASAGHTLAFVRREVSPGKMNQSMLLTAQAPQSPAQSPAQSPMLDAVRSGYLTAGDQILGDISPSPGRWATVAIKQSR
jgi:hypothetical protein